MLGIEALDHGRSLGALCVDAKLAFSGINT